MNTTLRPQHLLSIVMLVTTLTATAHAADKAEPPPKRPATPQECDPSSWVIDPAVDYTVCEEGSTRPRQ